MARWLSSPYFFLIEDQRRTVYMLVVKRWKSKIHVLEGWKDLMNSGQLALVLVPGAKGVDERQQCGSDF